VSREARVTTVVITHDRRDDLARTLPLHRGPVVLVDNGSTDGTVAWVRHEHPHVEVVALRRNIGAVARNVGVRRARTPYVAFADDDSWWEDSALERAADRLDRQPRLAVVTGRTVVEPQGVDDPVNADLARGPWVLGFLACAAVVRRDAFLEVGGFDALLGFRGEEELLALDLSTRGWELVYAADVVAHHQPSPRRAPAPAIVRRQTRNRVLIVVLRRPWRVLPRTVAEAWASGTTGRLALVDALLRLPVALVRRRRLPAEVERRVRELQAPRVAE
jgi:GT2 family glycosyltransferase